MQIDSWNEVDNTLKRLCELEVAIAKIEGEATIKMNQIKDKAKHEASSLQVEKDALEKQITIFCECNKAEFAHKRSKEFNFGTVGYRITKSVTIPHDKNKIEALIKTLKALGLKDCIAYEEKPNKEKLIELDDSSFAKLGLKKTIKDSFRIQPSIEKIEQNI